MADNTPTQQPMSETQGMPAGTDPVAQFRAYMQAQQQMGPAQQPTRTQVQPFQEREQRGPMSNKQASIANLGTQIHNTLGQIGQKFEQRKAIEQSHVFDRYTQASKGVLDAQQQMREAQESLKQNPQDPQALQQFQSAQMALKQNQTILDAMFNGKSGDKYYKMLQKGFGIDDKNANTPERQQAKQAYMKAMGVGDRAASIGSQIPITQQPGGMKPPTGGQLLNAAEKDKDRQQRMSIEQLKLGEQRGMKDDQLAFMGEMKGVHAFRGSDGKMKYEEFTPEERAKIPRLKAEDDLKAANAEFEREKTNAMRNPDDPTYKLRLMDSQSKKLDAEARMKAADAQSTRAMIAKMKEGGEPDSVKEARKAITKLTEDLSKTQLAISQQNAGFFGTDKFDANRAQGALTTLQNQIKEKQAVLDAYKSGEQKGADSVSDDEILKGLDDLK